MPMSRRTFLSGMALTGAASTAARTFLAFAADNNTIVVSQGSDVLTLDPMLDTSPISINVFRNVFDALTRIGADGTVVPLLAESWTASEDTRTWEFTIRANAKFHDGAPVTVDDVVWSYQRLPASRSRRCGPISTRSRASRRRARTRCASR